MMLHSMIVIIGWVGLTSPHSWCISHAHAGLAKLRPPLPSTLSSMRAAVATW